MGDRMLWVLPDGLAELFSADCRPVMRLPACGFRLCGGREPAAGKGEPADNAETGRTADDAAVPDLMLRLRRGLPWAPALSV